MRSLPDRVRWTREEHGERVVYRLASGMTLETEVLHRSDPLRILPLGTPQGALINHLLAFPERVRGRRVLEPFAGAGPLGLTALRLGAAHVDLLDVNPRAAAFQRANAARNGLPTGLLRSLVEDVAEFEPEAPYDVLLANPPFVPTPEGVPGTLTSSGGPDGNRLVEVVLERLEALLAPEGRALVYLMQLVREGRPLVVELLERLVGDRAVELTPSQEHPIGFESLCWAYRTLFPARLAAIDAWREGLVRRHGETLGVSHYVLEIGPREAGAGGWAIRDDFRQRFGEAFLVPCDDERALAFGRAFENLVPGAG